MADQLLIGSAFPTAAERISVDQAAQTAQQNRLALKVQQMQIGELEKQTGVKNFLASNWRQMTAPIQDQPTPAANNLAPQQPTPTVGPPQPPQGNALAPSPSTPTMGSLQSPPASQPTPQFPSDDDLMKAVQSGRIPAEVADGVRSERVQYEAAQKQAQTASKLEYFKKLGEEALKNGDNDTFQTIMKKAKEDPLISPMIPDLGDVKVTGKEEFHVVKPYTAKDIAAISAKFPQLGIDPATTPPGTYKLGMKNGKPTDWEPKGGTGKPADYPDFVKGFAYEHPELTGDALTAAANREWHRLKVIEQSSIGQNRIPALQPIQGAFDPETGAPMVFNRRTGSTTVSKVEGGKDVAAAKQDYAASTAALRDNEKRLTAITAFTNRIDRTIPIVERLAKKYGNDFGGKLNEMRSNIKRGVGNTGDLKSLELALFAITGELTKTEMQATGVAGASATQMEHMAKILNESTNASDILAVMPTIKELSNTSKSAIKDVSDDIRKARKHAVGAASNIVGKDIKEGQRFDILIKGEKRTGVKKNGKLVFDKIPANGVSLDELVKRHGGS